MSGALHEREWFDAPHPGAPINTDKPGLRFTCTQCGNCCTGPSGFVLFTDNEAAAMAHKLGVTPGVFRETYTRETPIGRSLRETRTSFGYDCVFLDRDEQGRTSCRVYEDRPEQCRTWPFWRSNLRSKRAWADASQGCPGMNTGAHHDPSHVRLTRERVEI